VDFTGHTHFNLWVKDRDSPVFSMDRIINLSHNLVVSQILTLTATKSIQITVRKIKC